MPREYKLFGSLCACLYLELLGGGVYAFSVYSVYLKEHFGLTQGRFSSSAHQETWARGSCFPRGAFSTSSGRVRESASAPSSSSRAT